MVKFTNNAISHNLLTFGKWKENVCKIFNSNNDLIYLTLKEIFFDRLLFLLTDVIKLVICKWVDFNNLDTLNVKNKYFYYQVYGHHIRH